MSLVSRPCFGNELTLNEPLTRTNAELNNTITPLPIYPPKRKYLKSIQIVCEFIAKENSVQLPRKIIDRVDGRF